MFSDKMACANNAGPAQTAPVLPLYQVFVVLGTGQNFVIDHRFYKTD